MIKRVINLFHFVTLMGISSLIFAQSTPTKVPASTPHLSPIRHNASQTPRLKRLPPRIKVKSYLLMDVNSGTVLAEKNANLKLPPASLTKMMTMYIVSSALKQGQIRLKDRVTIGKKAWQTGGARMFLRSGEKVPVADLIKGVIVQSGNDATMALAEHVAGNETDFTTIMNQTAKLLKMDSTHYKNSTGMPEPKHVSTARDIAKLGQAIIKDFPDYYPWYKQKWYSHNGIRQPNRNRLLWRNPQVDGIKTGHTKDAGFCLVASAKHGKMRLLSVVLGAPTDAARADASQRLLDYGFRNYKSYTLYRSGQTLEQPRVWLGTERKIRVGLVQDLVVTIPKGEYKYLSAELAIDKTLRAPIAQGQVIGKLTLKMRQAPLQTIPIVALDKDPEAAFWYRFKDRIQLSMYNLLGIKNI